MTIPGRGLAGAGLRLSNGHHQFGNNRPGKLLAEGKDFEDWEVRHVGIDTVSRRSREVGCQAFRTLPIEETNTPPQRGAR